MFLIFSNEENKKELDQSFQITLRDIPVKDQEPLEEAPVQEHIEENAKEATKPQETPEENSEADKEPSPIDNADEMSTNNQDETIKGEVAGGGQISEEKDPQTTKKMSVEKSLDSPTSLVDQVDVVELQEPEIQSTPEAVQKEEKKPVIKKGDIDF